VFQTHAFLKWGTWKFVLPRPGVYALIESYAALPTNDYIRFELMRPTAANTYVAVGMSKDRRMVKHVFCRTCENA
jgi:hypothetical protein